MDLESSADARAVVDAVVKLAQALGLKVVAEGVETESQLEFLREKGCDEMQGFFFSPAVSADEMDTLLRRSAPAGPVQPPESISARTQSTNWDASP
ncbi:MAG TPA: EAL domain-containing protein, partial [Usitatibacter sp.]|nr:EAL domain-containing protein [Usitatibacter sp.]